MPTFDNLAQPFRNDKFDIYRRGISDHPEIDVYINEPKDFAFLYPAPTVDYSNYIPRVKKFGLTAYKKGLQVIERRFAKIEHNLGKGHHSLLEIGAGDGSFLKTVRRHLTDLHLTAIDKDQNSLASRAEHSDENFDSLEAVIANNRQYDLVCLFHVMEHIQAPLEFLQMVKKVMGSHSCLIIEVPSLFDPLISLYNCDAYSEFYFSRQHPYVFSPPSLERLMASGGFQTDELISFQRYGLENHLGWLNHGKPGGNAQFRQLFGGLESEYTTALENTGKTDTVIWIGRKATK